MKPALILSIVSVAVTGLLLTNCNPASKNLTALNYPVISTFTMSTVKDEIATARKEINSDFQKFVSVSYVLLKENETSINKLENMSGSVAENSENRSDKQITCLMTENNNLRIKLDNYIVSGSGNWKTFQSEFSHTLNDIEIARVNLQSNTK